MVGYIDNYFLRTTNQEKWLLIGQVAFTPDLHLSVSLRFERRIYKGESRLCLGLRSYRSSDPALSNRLGLTSFSLVFCGEDRLHRIRDDGQNNEIAEGGSWSQRER